MLTPRRGARRRHPRWVRPEIADCRLRGRVALAIVLALACVPACGDPMPSPRHDVLLVTIDTLRADYVHAYGFAEPTTPAIDALAERGVLFETAVAASSATVPSHASIMTSRFVREHSVGAWNGATRLDGLPTLAERFGDSGFATAAFVSNVVLKARTGLDRGFEVYDDDLPDAEPTRPIAFERTADATLARARAWLQEPRDRPFFVWVHLQDPHGPYTPPAPFDALVPSVPLRTQRALPVLPSHRGRGGIPDYQALAGLREAPRYAGRYAGEVAFTDHAVGALVGAAESASGERGLIVLLTADHGESLGEDGFFFQHGHATTPEQALVPFVLVAPGLPAARLPGPVHHVDVAPTLLALAGAGPLEGARGIALAEHARTQEPLRERTLFVDVGSEVAAYTAGSYVRVRISPGTGGTPGAMATDFERFDRGPEGWTRNRDGAATPAGLHDYLDAERPIVAAGALEPADAARLRALGYVLPENDAAERSP